MVYLLALIFWLLAPTPAAATYQQCSPSSTCTIGEFLYDDDYQPQQWAVCTLTAKYPDGTAFLTASASATTEAWYYYDATIGTTTGLYPANLCCTSGSDYLCIDKSFEVAAAASTLTANDVWSYSSRSLTGFGDLITDIWNHSSRSLTTFGDLITNIWNYTPTTSATSPAPLTAILQEQTEQRELLEKLVNQPIVSFSLEENQNIPDLNSKLEQSQVQANILFDLVKSAKKNLDNRQAVAALLDHPEALTALSEAWDAPIIARLNQAVTNVRQTLNQVSIVSLETLVGQANDTGSQNTLYGYLAWVRDRNMLITNEKQKLDSILSSWNDQAESDLNRTVNAAKSRALAINQYPDGYQIIQPIKTKTETKLALKNLLAGLQALLGLNQQMLAVNAGDPVRFLWSEEGSVIFKGVITNPSAIISQTVPLKFYLPRELKEKNIISLDPSLKTDYDASEEALYVSGDYTLQPETTKVVYIEVEDIWQLSQEELDSIKTQAAELIKPLEKTSYFAQGTVLKTEIDSSLGKISLNYSQAVTPESRIRAYREARLELTGVQTNLQRLQDLLAQASGTGSIFGFVGSIQAVAVWAILLIVITSFVFLTIYMKQLKSRPAKTKTEPAKEEDSLPTPTPRASFWANPAVIPIIILVTAITTVIIGQILLKQPKSSAPAIIETKTPAATQPTTMSSPAIQPSPSPEVVNLKEEKQVLGNQSSITLTVPKNGGINIRSGPAPDAPVVMTAKQSIEVTVFEQTNGWLRIGFNPTDSGQNWWVSDELVD